MANPIQSLYIDPQTLYVGIGTQRPQAHLTVAGHICPATNLVYDLGTSNLRFRDLYLSGNTLNLGGTSITRDPTTGGLKVTDPNSGNAPLDMTVRTLTVGNIGIGTTLPLSALDMSQATGAIILPKGSNIDIPNNPIVGMLRFNLSTQRIQYYNAYGWASIGGTSATGGIVTEIGGYRIHTFTSSDTLTVVSGGLIDYLVVAGGGGGGDRFGGGGGAGGLLYATNYTIASGSYSIVVGSGGAGGQTNNTRGTSGNTSSFGTIASTTGGGGGASENQSALNGGSGGGGSYSTITPGTGISGQGFGGGTGQVSVRVNGGGGGASEAGKGSGTRSDGGNGLQYSISGTAIYYAGGGGGADNRVDSGGTGGPTAGNGGLGGGGQGGGGESNGTADARSGVGVSGTVNTGGGGGGGSYIPTAGGGRAGGNGGSGIVIIRYLL
jgi:hypothetical protein